MLCLCLCSFNTLGGVATASAAAQFHFISSLNLTNIRKAVTEKCFMKHSFTPGNMKCTFCKQYKRGIDIENLTDKSEHISIPSEYNIYF